MAVCVYVFILGFTVYCLGSSCVAMVTCSKIPTIQLQISHTCLRLDSPCLIM